MLTQLTNSNNTKTTRNSMMKSVSLIILCTVMSIMAVAQKKTPTKNKNAKQTKSITVPAEINSAFQGKFADVSKQKWSKKADGNYVATFLGTDNVKQEVEFDSKGYHLKTRSIFTKDQVPELVST